ncbi:inner membrane protein [Pullulanibacillus pueri]|uniref:Metal-dependent hydrolase n=1 Tax=Pullulanibacillus pueri TaxID=1437324 RepID=A0A8J3A0L0_9BACL|nr:metal-dependent hydrolase [Pullulanibacillus pueri]MBM7680702.1 inner membrane protein [Pullulanibacillus pueri]GGH87549.1 hypothetical protein GCM10007096_37820 [Pullulanibacillus pueri]
MDSTTHIVMGIGLSGLAALDPVIAHESTTSGALFFGTLIGSVIPDIDTVLKMKDNATYIRHHRGATHSLPATLLWPMLITATLGLFFPGANLLHLWLWTFLSVFLHVFVDIFNAYGTQALRPLTPRWIALGIINIFDPFIFGIHIPGFLIWYFFGHSGITFLTIYLILIVYYFIRIFNHHQAVVRVKERLPDVQAVFLSPTFKWHQYHMAARTDTQLIVGEIKGKKVNIIDTFQREPLPLTDEVMAAKRDKNIMAFLSFSPIYRWIIKETHGYTEVRFVDLRYLSKGHYPFVAIAWVDPQQNIKSSYTGWVYSEAKIRKKLLAIHDS